MFRSYNDVIHRKPIITKALTQFVIFGAGDVFCQFIEKGQSKKASKKFDEVRSLKQAIFGFVFAPYGHFHFCKVIPFHCYFLLLYGTNEWKRDKKNNRGYQGKVFADDD